MAKKVFRDQLDDEEVLLVFRKHPVVMRKGLILFMLGLLAGVIPSYFPNATMTYFVAGLLGGLVLGFVLALPAWIYWYFTVYILTDKRFIQQTQRGFFHKSVSDIALKHVQSVNYQVSGIQETLLGFGTILLQTYLGDVLIHDVEHPEETSNKISEYLREYGDVESPSDSEVEASIISHER